MLAWWRANVIEPIHATRIPLPAPARRAMGLVYIFAPVVAGYYIMEWTNERRDANLGSDGAVLRQHKPSAVAEMHAQHQKQQLDDMLRSHEPKPDK